MRTVLLVSACARNTSHLKSGLATLGFRVIAAKTNASVWQAVVRQPVDGIVLNTSCASAELDPWHLVAELAALDHTPLIVLTRAACKQDRVRAFETGAQYCLTLPASTAELSACLNAVWIAQAGRARLLIHTPASDYADAQLQIDFTNRRIRRKGKEFPLTARESPLMQRLIQNSGKMISSEELCRLAWGPTAWPHKRNLLKTYIAQLRHKIERNARRPRYLISRRGLGYGFMPPQ